MSLNKYLALWSVVLLWLSAPLSSLANQEKVDSLAKVIPKLSGCEKQVAIGKLAAEFNGSAQLDTCYKLIKPIIGTKRCEEAEIYYARYKSDSFFFHFILDSALLWNEKSILGLEQFPNEKLYQTAIFRKGHLSALQGNFDNTVQYFPEVMAYSKKHEKWSFYDFVAVLYMSALLQKGLYNDLQERAQEILIEAKARNNDALSASCNYNLASASFELKLFDRARSYNRTALQLLTSNQVQPNYNALVGVYALDQKLYQLRGQADSVKFVLQLADQAVKNLDYRNQAWQLTNWAEFYIDNQQWDSALIYTDRVLANQKIKTDAPLTYYFMHESKANVLINKGMYEEAKKNLRPAIEFYSANKNFDELRHCYSLMSRAFYHANQLDSGDFYREGFEVIQDSLYSSSMQDKIAEIEVRFETRQKEEQLIAQQRLLEEQLQLAKQQKITIWITLSALIALSVLVFAIYRSRKRLAASNKTVEERSLQLAEKNDENELLLKEIHHRVKNNLQVIMSLLDLQAMRLDESASKEALISSQARIKSMALIHEELYQQERFSVIKFDEYLDILVDNITAVFDLKNKTHIHKDIVKAEIDIDTAIPLALIVNEILTNAFKYGKSQDGSLHVTMTAKLINGVLELEIRDRGEGLPVSAVNGKTTSLGLRIVKRLAKQIEATFTLDGSNEGTSFRISTKLDNPLLD